MEDPGRAFSGVDNLSRLPDELLSRILSLLCTKDAVRTSVLSTRWRYLYTSISNLDFEFTNATLRHTDAQECMNIVDRFLFRRKKCAIDKFKLKWEIFVVLDTRRLKKWIRVVLRHGIRELDLCIYYFEPKYLLLPSSLFTSKTLEVLKFDMWLEMFDPGSDIDSSQDDVCEPDDYGLQLPAKVCLPSLKTLHLRNVNFSWDDNWSRLFSNCPILEDFFFNFEKGFCFLSVSSPTLKRMTLDSSGDYWKDNKHIEIVVDAPSLVYFEYSVSRAHSLEFVNTQSLVEANIAPSQYRIENFSFMNCGTDLMRGISNVQTLRMGSATVNALKEYTTQIPVLHNLTHLTIHHYSRFGLSNLPYLLEKCESLETLVIKNDLPVWQSHVWNGVEESTISCLTFGLKTFEVYNFAGKEHEIEMLKYFLKSAKALELIEVHLDSRWDDEDAPEITKELQMLPRSSKARVDVVF